MCAAQYPQGEDDVPTTNSLQRWNVGHGLGSLGSVLFLQLCRGVRAVAAALVFLVVLIEIRDVVRGSAEDGAALMQRRRHHVQHAAATGRTLAASLLDQEGARVALSGERQKEEAQRGRRKDRREWTAVAGSS